MSEHTFDKLRLLDCTLAELETVLDTAEIIEESQVDASGTVKELLLALDWRRPLHAVVVVDEQKQEERLVTVYEPDPDRWSPDYRRRR